MNEAKTLNERLVYYEQLKRFEKAIKKKDRKELLLILQSIGLTKSNMDDVDFLIENTKLEHTGVFEKIKNFFNIY